MQVKCTTKKDGSIAWRGPGDRARTLNVTFIDDGHGGALVVLVHVQSAPTPLFAGGSIVIPKPTSFQIAATDAVTFGDNVDHERRVYGATLRQRIGGNSEEIGSLLSPEGLAYPTSASQNDDLAVYLQTLPS